MITLVTGPGWPSRRCAELCPFGVPGLWIPVLVGLTMDSTGFPSTLSFNAVISLKYFAKLRQTRLT